MRTWIGYVVPVLAVLFLTGCPQDGAELPAAREPAARAQPSIDADRLGQLPPGVTAEMVAEGQQLFGTVCVACHGPAGAGTPLGPALNDQQWIHITGELDEIVQITEAGVVQPQQYAAPMPRMGGAHFSQEQLRSLGAYVWALSRGRM